MKFVAITLLSLSAFLDHSEAVYPGGGPWNGGGNEGYPGSGPWNGGYGSAKDPKGAYAPKAAKGGAAWGPEPEVPAWGPEPEVPAWGPPPAPGGGSVWNGGGSEVDLGFGLSKVDFSGELFWIHDNVDGDADGLYCAYADHNQEVASDPCNPNLPKFKWEIIPVEPFGFQVRNVGLHKCVATNDAGSEGENNDCSDGNDVKLIPCAAGGKPDVRSVWYVNNIGTFNSYYCSYVATDGLYWLDPRKNGNWEIRRDVDSDETTGFISSYGGMFNFWPTIPTAYVTYPNEGGSWGA